jgi:hypothetical protein
MGQGASDFGNAIQTGVSYWNTPGSFQKTAKKMYDTFVERPDTYIGPRSIGEGLENIVRIGNAYATDADPTKQVSSEALAAIHTTGDIIQNVYDILPASGFVTEAMKAATQVAAGEGYDRLGNVALEGGLALLPEPLSTAVNLGRDLMKDYAPTRKEKIRELLQPSAAPTPIPQTTVPSPTTPIPATTNRITPALGRLVTPYESEVPVLLKPKPKRKRAGKK